MNFAGYIPLHRGLIEHTMSGRMTNNEALVFVWLLMLADRTTGGYTINGPTLRVYLPGLTKSAAQRALEGLERKGYIYRDITPRSPLAYPYFIQGFHITDGPHKLRQLDLSEVFATKDISKRRYTKRAPDGAPAMRPDTEPAMRPEGANYNKTEKRDGDQTQETSPLCSIDECATSGAMKAQRVSTEGSIPGEAGAPQCASTAAQLPDNCSPTASQLPRGYELRDGRSGYGVYTDSGVKVSESVVAMLYRSQHESD